MTRKIVESHRLRCERTVARTLYSELEARVDRTHMRLQRVADSLRVRDHDIPIRNISEGSRGKSVLNNLEDQPQQIVLTWYCMVLVSDSI